MKNKHVIRKLIIVVLLGSMILPFTAHAAQITGRSVQISSAAAGATNVSYSFKFTVPSTGTNVRSVQALICDQDLGACTNAGSSSGFSALSATLNSQPTGFGGGAAWTTASTQYAFRITRASASSAPSGQQTVTFDGVTNPAAINVSGFYLRVTTYSDTAYSTPIDTGTVVAVIANQINVTGTMPESLVFCVGATGTDCSNLTGTSVDVGTFSPTYTNVGTSKMSASTNVTSGFAITVNGTTPASGGFTIPAMGTQASNSLGCAPSCTSAIGTSQFGINVVGNNVASAGGPFGADVTGPGTGTAFGGYGLANQFRFYTGDTVAGAVGGSDTNLYTASYLFNVRGSQTAGTYSATMTYICTATF